MSWKLPELGWVPERRALALGVLGFFGTIYLLTALGIEGPWMRPFVGLALCYLVAFFAVASEWFWGRWFASGLGWSGVMLGAFGIAMIGWSPALAIYGGLHGLAVLGLSGKGVSERYEGRSDWRSRYQLGDPAAQRLGRAVVRVGASLPSLILWALAPREEPGHLLVLLCAIVGLAGLLRGRTWGALAVGTGGVAAAVLSGRLCYWVGGFAVSSWAARLVPTGWVAMNPGAHPHAFVVLPTVPALLLLAFVPFALPTLRYLRKR